MRSLKGLALLLAAAPIAAATTWTSVRTGGGGGFVPGIVFHPKAQGVAYIRTDIGGMYRLNSDDSWTFISDSLVGKNAHNMGTDAIALDPQNADVIYAALGLYTNSWDPDNGAIVKSTDRGNTWTFSHLPFKVGGNMPGRGTGERLSVDPHNSNIIYFGARSGNGLWKSTDGGATFSKVTSFTNTGTYDSNPGQEYGGIMGLLFVTFDSTSSTINGATSRIFVGVADNTASVYESKDAGSTWSAVPGQPGKYFPHKCKLQPTEKALYLSYSNGIGPYDGSNGSVWRYDLMANTWRDITPPVGWSTPYFGYGGLAVDMQKPGTLMVASLNSWWPSAQIYRSNDSGLSWTPIWEWGDPYYPNKLRYYSLSSPNARWIENTVWQGWNTALDSNALGWMIEALEIDPFDSNHWLYGTGLTIMGGHDLTNWDSIHNVSIKTLAAGIEEMAVIDIISVPGGSELLMAVGDDSGFTYVSASDLGTAPSINWVDPTFATSTGVDYAGLAVGKIVRAGNGYGSPQIGISSDGGKTWSIASGVGNTALGGSVAYSASGDTIVWSTTSQGVVRSQNGGSLAGVGVPAYSVIASDKQNNNYFYAGYNMTVYVSSDNGQNFAWAANVGGRINAVIVHPTIAGQVYLGTNAGIYRSTNFGSSWTVLTSDLTNVTQIAFGVGSGSTWNLYAFGAGYNGNRLYGSRDSGTTWADIQGTYQFGAGVLAGSGNVAGQVYVSGPSGGVIYANVEAALSCTVAGYGQCGGQGYTGCPTCASGYTCQAGDNINYMQCLPPTNKPPPAGSCKAAAYRQCGGVGFTGCTSCPSGYTCQDGDTIYYKQCLPPNHPPSPANNCTVAGYSQCGGQGYTGCTTCASGYTCQNGDNIYYKQCLPPPASDCTVAGYDQCGGQGYNGCMNCASGYTCQAGDNIYYMQCLPPASANPSASPTPTPAPNAGNARHDTPEAAAIAPLAGCTTLPPTATFTLTPACSSAAANLPNSGANNSPPGPDPCPEDCDLFRLLTKTCCGAGGGFSNPIVIPAGVGLPLPIRIPIGFVPNTPIGVPIQEPADNSNPNDPNVRRIPAGQNTTVAFWIPAGWAPVPPGAAPLIIPPHEFPESDPPSEPDATEPSDMCDPQLTDVTGLCGNGNFPFYSPDSGIDCDLADTIDENFLTFCQSWALDNPTAVSHYVEVVKECLTCPGYGGLGKRSLELAGFTTGNVSTEAARVQARADTCPPPPSDTPGSSTQSGTPPCERTFVCDGSRWPNICGNAESAISVRGFSSVMTRIPTTKHLTGPWYLTKFGTDGKTTGGTKPAPGWGLVGCNVEEYPFASGRGSGTKAALRLVPQVENSDHAYEMSRFYQEWEDALPRGERTIGRTFCISFTNSKLTSSNDYGLDKTVAGDLNICAKPYGPEFLLVTGGRKVGQENPAEDWDPWFNAVPGRLTTQTYASHGTTIKTRVGPPLYCRDPSPGLHEYVNGAWRLHPLGEPRPPKPDGGPGGQSLGCAPVPQTVQKRRYGARDRLEKSSLNPIAASSKANKRGNEIRKRLTAGSLLDVNVYQYLPMCSSNDDYDPCDAKPCNYYDDNGDFFPVDVNPVEPPPPATTPTPTLTTEPTPTLTNEPPPATTTGGQTENTTVVT